MYETKPDDPLFVDDLETPLTEAEATYYLREAYKIVTGDYPSLNSLSILWAQSALECARWKKIHLSNWGNIKKMPGVKYTSYKCSEVLNGHNQVFVPYHPQTFFAAWDSQLEGATAYLKFLAAKSRYQKAWQQIQKGDPVQYCAELKAAGYFTADLTAYTKGVVSLTNEFKKKSEQLLAWKPKEDERRSQLPTSVGEEPLPLPPLIPLDLSTLEYHPDQESPKNIEIPNQGWFIVLINAILELFKFSK